MFKCFPRKSRFIGDTDLKAQKARNKDIEKFMKNEKRKMQTKHNILLLGTGESGKSTFLKQMKLINGKEFTKLEIERFKDTIFDNIYKGILFLIHAHQTMGIELENDVTQAAIGRIEEHYKEHKNEQKDRSAVGDLIWSDDEFLPLIGDIKTIWDDQGIKESFNNRSKMMTENFSENSRYYLNNLTRIGVKNYIPNNEDIVWSRKPTDSIIEEEIPCHSLTIVFIDVGGQTKERKKWCQMFQGMNSVLFLIASSHYDEYYYDRMSREHRNKLREAMRVFGDLINVQYFMDVSVIIFFNKTDVLIEKVNSKITSIKDEFLDIFPTNSDPHNITDVQNFLVDTFVSYVDNPGIHGKPNLNTTSSAIGGGVRNSFNDTSNRRYSVTQQKMLSTSQPAYKKRTLYRHFTTAIDRGNIETVFNAMKDTILQRNINQLVMR